MKTPLPNPGSLLAEPPASLLQIIFFDCGWSRKRARRSFSNSVGGRRSFRSGRGLHGSLAHKVAYELPRWTRLGTPDTDGRDSSSRRGFLFKRARVLRIITVFFATIFCAHAEAEEPRTPESPALVAFVAWRDAVGLTDTFRVVSEQSTSTKYQLTLDAGHLEEVIGQQAANEIYRQLIIKVISFGELSPAQVELHVLSLEGGFCDPSGMDNNVKMTDGNILIDRKLYRKPRGIRCMLNFEYIRKYTNHTKDVVGRFKRNTSSTPTVDTDRAITTERIKQYLSERYTKKGATVTVTSVSANWLGLTVRRLRSEVIGDKKYWERLQVMVVLEPTKTTLRIHLILDGRYGSGLAPPSEEGYSDMEPAYTSYLDEYGKSLVLALGKV